LDQLVVGQPIAHFKWETRRTEQAGEDRGNAMARNIVVPSAWREFFEQTGIPAAVWAGNTLRLTGHTGDAPDGSYPEGLEVQLRATFANIELTLTEAGLGWPDVVEINAYHVGLLDQTELVLRFAAEFLDVPFPAWTAVGVTELFVPEALVEVRCVAEKPSAGQQVGVSS
jgi:enamine deaminase RidA (YjgF/YER057c/UK114 family)